MEVNGSTVTVTRDDGGQFVIHAEGIETILVNPVTRSMNRTDGVTASCEDGDVDWSDELVEGGGASPASDSAMRVSRLNGSTRLVQMGLDPDGGPRFGVPVLDA